jgi:hypothetical protein
MIADLLDALSSPSSSSAAAAGDDNDVADDRRRAADGTTGARRRAPPADRTAKRAPLAAAPGGPGGGNDAATVADARPGGGPGRPPTPTHPSGKNARYSRPGPASALVQAAIGAAGGHVFARAFALPHLGPIVGLRADGDVVVLSCLMAPMFELLPALGGSELNYRRHCDGPVLDAGGESPGDGGRRRRFRHRLLPAALPGDVVRRVRRSVLGRATVLPPLLAAAAASLWSRCLGGGPSVPGDVHGPLAPPYHSSYATTVLSLLSSYAAVAVLVSILAVQDVFARWAVCAPGTDADVLMFRARSSSIIAPSKKDHDYDGDDDGDDGDDDAPFLAEDLIVQSVLMGDGLTVDAVIAAPPRGTTSRTTSATSTLPRSVNSNHQEDEIRRNEVATASFSAWIERSSTTASGRLSDDVLRMCILESLGGGGSSSGAAPARGGGGPFYFGRPRHAAAVRRRLDLSAAASCPGRQPIAAPVVRALCAFAGGVGDALSSLYCRGRRPDGDGEDDGRRPPPPSSRGGGGGGFRPPDDGAADLWRVPPGSLHAAEFAIIAAARLVVMNSVVSDNRGRAVVNASRRHDRLSLLLPCVLHSAYKLHRGIHEYAEATAAASGLDLSTHDTTGRGDGAGCYIAAECPELCPVISACRDSAKMAMRILATSGDQSFEDLLLRRKWKGDLQQWLVGL